MHQPSRLMLLEAAAGANACTQVSCTQPKIQGGIKLAEACAQCITQPCRVCQAVLRACLPMWLSQGVTVPEQVNHRPPSFEASMFCGGAEKAEGQGRNRATAASAAGQGYAGIGTTCSYPSLKENTSSKAPTTCFEGACR
jgi:hypothetical protein